MGQMTTISELWCFRGSSRITSHSYIALPLQQTRSKSARIGVMFANRLQAAYVPPHQHSADTSIALATDTLKHAPLPVLPATVPTSDIPEMCLSTSGCCQSLCPTPSCRRRRCCEPGHRDLVEQCRRLQLGVGHSDWQQLEVDQHVSGHVRGRDRGRKLGDVWRVLEGVDVCWARSARSAGQSQHGFHDGLTPWQCIQQVNIRGKERITRQIEKLTPFSFSSTLSRAIPPPPIRNI